MVKLCSFLFCGNQFCEFVSWVESVKFGNLAGLHPGSISPPTELASETPVIQETLPPPAARRSASDGDVKSKTSDHHHHQT